jgi:hypothetical protein
MSDNARFHNKLHRKNHHTLPTTGYPDSAIDPIASPKEPFKGDFHIVGSLSASYNIYAGHRVGVQTSNPNYEVSIQGSLSASRDAFIDNNLVVGNDATVGNSLTSFGDTVLGTTANDEITINAGPIKMPNAINAVDAIIMGGDTNLYRGAANTLQTDDDLYVRANTTLGDACTDTTTINGTLNINCSTVANGIKFSNGSGTYDTNLYRSAADTLKTDDSFEVGSSTRLGDANTDQTVIRGITKIADSSSTNGILFGSGDANYDVNLYRKSANVLKTDDALEVGGGMSIAGDFSVAGNTTLGDTCDDIINLNGLILVNCSDSTRGVMFSDGTQSSNLYLGPNYTIQAQNNFEVNQDLSVDGNTTLGNANTDQTVIRGITKIADSSSTNGILFGSGNANYDTNLYRSATNELKTDDNFVVAANTTLGDANTDQTVIRGITKIADSSSTNGILFGTGNASYDTNLYRSAAGTLRTDDDMIVAGNLTIVGNLTALGTYSRLDTLITGTSSMQIINAGSDLALYVEQKGATDVARFVDDGTTALIVKNGGNVGIGVDSPQGRLHVDGLNTNDNNAEVYITGSCGWMQHHVSLAAGSWNPLAADCDKGIIFSEGTVNTGNLLIAPWSNSSNGIRILANGNVGIGVQTAGTKLDVAGDGRFTANSETLKLVGTDHTYIGWFPDGVAAGRKAWTGFGNATQNYFTITNEINDGSGHIVLTPGTNANVGIGNIAPTSRLHVNGTFRTSGTATIDTINTGTTDTVLVVNASGTVEKRTINSSTWNTTTGVVNGTGTANYVTKWSGTGTITNSIIRDDGTYVGIGIAPSSAGKLNVGGTIKASRNDTGSEGGQIVFGRSTDNGSMYGIDVYGNTATPNLRILDLVAATARMEMNSTGNFGFGTAPNTTDRVRIGGNIYASGTARIGTINAGATDTVLVVDANGTVQKRTINSGAWSGAAGGVVDGAGTANYISKWSGSNTLTDSIIYESGSSIGINTTAPTPGVTVDVYNAAFPVVAVRTETNPSTFNATNNGGVVVLAIESSTGGSLIADTLPYSGVIAHTSARALHFGRNNGVDMTISSTGRVGIGTTAPGTLLAVNGTFSCTTISCTTINTNNSNITMGTGDLSCDAIGCGAISSGAITTNNNNINAGTGNIAGAIITGSTLRSTGDVVAYYVSDSRLKENKAVLNNSLEKLQKIEAYSFDWKEVDDSICTRRGHDVGLLAQEVREILPEAILERDNGYLSLDYIKMIPLLVSSIKELKAEIEILKAK